MANVEPVERYIQNSTHKDGVDCIYLYENGKAVGCITGRPDDPEVQTLAAKWVMSAVKRHPALSDTPMPAGGYPALAGATVREETQTIGSAGSPTTFTLAEALAVVHHYGQMAYLSAPKSSALRDARLIISASAVDAMERALTSQKAPRHD